MTRKQIEDSPGIESERRLAREREAALHRYYGWPPYWGGGMFTAGMAGLYPEPHIDWAAHERAEPGPEGAVEGEQESAYQPPAPDPHLRSLREVTGYGVHANDGDIGHMEDFLADDERWALRYMVIDTRSLLPSKDVLLGVSWIEDVNWDDARIHVRVAREKIRSAPEYKKGQAVNRAYEEELHRHYGIQGYWTEVPGTPSGRR